MLWCAGEEEFLVGASPEMFVRCDGKRVETCPISGKAPAHSSLPACMDWHLTQWP